MEYIEIINGDSCLYTMKKVLPEENIIKLNMQFNLGDLSLIKKYKQEPYKDVDICKELGIPSIINKYNFKKEMNKIENGIKKGKILRIWTSHYDVYSYLNTLYICNLFQDIKPLIKIIYSDDIDSDAIRPACCTEEMLISLLNKSYNLSEEDILNNSKLWEELVSTNSEMRILENNKIISVNIDYYDKYILDALNNMGEVPKIKLVGKLMGEIYLNDIDITYLINRLIKKNKIVVTKRSNERSFQDIIKNKE